MKPFLEPGAAMCKSGYLFGALLIAALGACATPSNRAAPGAEANAPAATPVVIQGDAQQRFQQALALMKEHKSDEAQGALEALVKDFPGYSGPQTDLGILYARAKQRDKAFNSFRQATTTNPKNATAYDWQGILYRESGDYASAESAYLKALAAQPDYAGAHLNLAILYDLYLRRPQDAVAQYREYQRIAGAGKPIVGAWIYQLEPPAAAPAPDANTATPPNGGRTP